MIKYHQKAEELDMADSMSNIRERFSNEDNLVYLDGNSLGKLPRMAYRMSSDIMRKQWGRNLIRSWNDHWLDLDKRLASKIAQIVGAYPDEIFVGDTTSLNLFKLVFASLKIQTDRKVLLTDSINFPTDHYILQGMVRQHFQNHELKIIPSQDGMSVQESDIDHLLDRSVAMLTLSHVNYKSSFMYDMAKINKKAKECGALMIWDLSHSVGAIPIDLSVSKTDMAVGCTYKFLNGGPGSPAFLYVNRKLQAKLENPIQSWFSHAKPFDFDEKYIPSEGISKFAISTPSILSLSAIEPGLDITLEAGLRTIRKKSLKQSEFLIEMIRSELHPIGFQLASPAESTQRGSHVSIRHEEAYRINKALIEPVEKRTIFIPDFRPPDNIRIGITPLYLKFTELVQTIERIKEIVENNEYLNYSNEKTGVT